MSRRFAVCLSVLLLLVGFLVPALLSGWITGSTAHYYYGWPVFFRLELRPAAVGDRLYRDFRSSGTTSALFFYMLFPLLVGFLAGRLSSRRPPGA